MLLKRIIAKEVEMYVEFCEKAAQHDPQEELWRSLAHATFYHIQELRSTEKSQSPIL